MQKNIRIIVLFMLLLVRLSIEIDEDEKVQEPAVVVADICDLCYCSNSTIYCTYANEKLKDKVDGTFYEIHGIIRKKHFSYFELNIEVLKMNFQSTQHDIRMDYNALENLYMLKELDTRGVMFNQTPNVVNSYQLRQITLQHARLKSIEANFCENKNNLLFKVDISFNVISELNYVFSGCTSLLILDLSYNKLKTLNDITSIPLNVRILNAKFNSIEFLNEHDLENLRGLEELTLEHNNLKYIHESSFAYIKHLDFLILSSNNLKSLPKKNTEAYRSLRVLKTENNVMLHNFPDATDFHNIEVLQLQYAYHCCPFMELQRKLQTEYDAVSTSSAQSNNGELVEYVDIERLKNATNFYDTIGDMDIDADDDQIIPVIHVGDFYKKRSISCTPLPNPFSPCENLLGDWWLRISVWVISTLGILCNLFAIVFNIIDGVYLYHQNMLLNVPVFLLTNLALSDLLMSLYLLLIAIKDTISRGIFDKIALIWQYSFSCNLAGFLSIASFLSSAFLLSFITFERYYAIKNSLDFNKRINFKQAIQITLIVWAISICIATLPVFDKFNTYSVYAICLPLDASSVQAKFYIIILITILFACFISICIFYGLIFFTTVSLERRGSSTLSCDSDEQLKQRNNEDQKLARNISLLIFANIISWGPSIILCISGMVSKNGINRFWFKILAVFIMPLNSLINPILYCLSRRRFRFYLLKFLSYKTKDRKFMPVSTSSTATTSH